MNHWKQRLAQLRFRGYPELWLFLAIALVGWPTRGVLAGLSQWAVATLGLVIFLLPGAAAVSLLRDDGPWWERLVLAFVASLGLVGVVSQTAIFLHTRIAFVAWGYLALTAALLAATLLRKTPIPAHPPPRPPRTALWVWGILGLMLVIVTAFQLNAPLDGDHMDAQGYIQNMRYDPRMMVEEPKFNAGLPVSPRFDFSAWLTDQAMISYLTGQNPWDQFQALRLPLMLMTLAAFYRLARRIASGRAEVAALSTAIWILFLVTSNRGTVAGYEVVVRPDLDKVVAGFVVLPVGLAVVLDIFERRQKRTWVWLVLFGLAAGLTHPIASVLIGLSLIWFSVIELLAQRNRATFWRLAAVGAVIGVFALGPSVYSFIRGAANPEVTVSANSLTDTRDPSMARRLRATLDHERILILENGTYLLHPRLIFQTAHLPAFLALPVLLWRQRRSRAARLLFGMLTVIPILLLLPVTAGLLGRFTTPWLLYRLHWPISMAAVIVVGWGLWSLLDRLTARLTPPDPKPALQRAFAGLAPFLLAAAWLLTLAAAYPSLRISFTFLRDRKYDPDDNGCVWADPLLRPFQ